MGKEVNSVELKQEGARMQMRQTRTGGAKVIFTLGSYAPVEIIVPGAAAAQCAKAFDLAAITLRTWSGA
jgi:hypothetical protein